jgi:hypothetical protein
MSFDTNFLVFSKSLALIQKTKKRVAQVDGTEFPTPNSEIARKLLLITLETLADEKLWPAMNPEALYNVLINIQNLVEQIESSNNEHISWPLVSFCDNFWRQLFPKKDAKIFYSVMKEHNYGIGSFSFRLKSLIEKILPPAEITKILNGENLYCLQLASLEDENLPLYANIGHEFGHAFYWAHANEILTILEDECGAVFRDIVAELSKPDPSLVNKRANKTIWIIASIATELFCDIIGFMISGPAFLLSLHEMMWGIDQGTWSAHLTPIDVNIKAYPSFRFRLHCLYNLDRISSFEKESIKVFSGLNKEKIPLMASYLSTICTDYSSDRVEITAVNDPDSDRLIIESAILKYFVQLQETLKAFVSRCWNDFITKEMKEKQFPPTSTEDVFELLHRLENDILPNIIPDKTLLGKPASFNAILNASAFYRIYMLSTVNSGLGTDTIYRDIQKVERLTAKAFEVSYIQREFENWKDK